MTSLNPINLFDLLLILIELALLYTTYRTTVHREIKGVIAAYRWQSILLAFTTGVTAVIRMQAPEADVSQGPAFTPFLIFLIFLLPLALGILIEPILTRATVFAPETPKETKVLGRFSFFRGVKSFIIPTPKQKAVAERIWLLQRGKSRSFSNVLFVALLAVAALIAFIGIPSDPQIFELPDRFGLFVSITLHLVGLYNTTAKSDIISQTIGVLTMDQGLYLAVIKIVSIPVPATFFVLSLYAYTLITIVLLIIIMPQVRHTTGSIDLDDISGNSGLEG